MVRILDHDAHVSLNLLKIQWNDYSGGPTLADAILDRLAHNTYQLNLNGESMRKTKLGLAATASSE